MPESNTAATATTDQTENTKQCLDVFTSKMLELPDIDGVLLFGANRKNDSTYMVAKEISNKELFYAALHLCEKLDMLGRMLLIEALKQMVVALPDDND